MTPWLKIIGKSDDPLRDYLMEMRDGKLPDIRPLRKNDEFKDVHALLVDVVSSLRKRRDQELSVLKRMLDLARSSEASASDQHKTAINTLAAQVQQWRQEAEAPARDAAPSQTTAATPSSASSEPAARQR